MSEAVTVDTATPPTLPVVIGSTTRTMTYNAADSTSTKLQFDYTVVDGEEDTDGVSFEESTLTGTITRTSDSKAADLEHAAVPDDADAKVATDTPGTVTLSPDETEMGIPITATLADDDGGITGTTWQWSSADTADGTFTAITGAASATYRPAEADLMKYLQATATYSDAGGPGKSASETTTSAVTVVENRSFLDNIGQLSAFTYEGDPGIASRFRTGGHPAGYKLSEIRITLAVNTYSHSSVTMHVYSARSDGFPNRSIFQMVGPDTFSGWTEFDAPVGARLEPNTTYYAAMVSDSQDVFCIGALANRYGTGRASDWSAEKAYIINSQGNWNSSIASEGCGIRIRGEAALDTPYVTDIDITSTPADSDGYIVGETLEATVTMNEAVTVDTATPPTLSVVIGSTTRTMTYNATESTNTKLQFDYTVVDGERGHGRGVL